MKEHKKDLLEKYILIENYIDYVHKCLHNEDMLDVLRATGEFDKMMRDTINEIKCKIKNRADIYRTGDVVKLHPSLIKVLDKKDENKNWRNAELAKQWDILIDKINKAIAQIEPSNWYKVNKVYNNTIMVAVNDDWRYFEIHYYSRKNRVGDCTVAIPQSQLCLYHEDYDNTRELTEYSKEANKSVMQIASAITYLYNNTNILEDICQAMFVYDVEKDRIEKTYEDVDDNLTNEIVVVLEAAARQAYHDGKLSV